MASIVYRANLSAKSFPLLSRNQSRTVIVPGNDQPYTRYGSPGERTQDVNTPSAYYMENVLPTLEGYKAVGYKTFTMNLSGGAYPGGVFVTNVYPSVVAGGSYRALIETSAGTFYHISQGGVDTFERSSLFLGNTVANYRDDVVTYGTVNNATYVFMYDPIAGNTFSKINGTTMTNTVPAGLSLPNTRGIISANGYLIAYGGVNVSWSSLVDPTDFVPSLITGAGGGAVQDLDGTIVFCVPASFGFVVYGQKNAVAAVYTGNSRNPFKFTAIRGSGGGVSPNLVVRDAGEQFHIAWTTKGFQEIGPVTANPTMPGLTDFVYTRYKEQLNTSTNVLSNVDTTRRLGRLTFVAGRYLVYSFNTASTSDDTISFTDAIVYDKLLDRYGKVKIPHVRCVEFLDYANLGSGTPFYALSYSFYNFAPPLFFIDTAGQVYQYSFRAAAYTGGESSILLGKFTYVRAKRLCLDKVLIENSGELFDSTSISCTDLPEQDAAANETPVAGYLVTNRPEYCEFHFHVDALNHSLLIKGGFNLTNVQLEFHSTGNS